jgi:hypothetical protein
MKSLRNANQTHSLRRSKKLTRSLATLSCAVVAAAALAIPMSASASLPATGSLYFAKSTAKLVGDTALVPVRCVGAKGSTCSGTLSIQAGGTTTEAPFSVTSGGNRTVSIPTAGASSGSSVVATAETVQVSGAYATATEVLRLR